MRCHSIFFRAAVLALVIGGGAIGCRTTQGAGALRADKVDTQLQSVEEAIEKSSATPEEKKVMRAKVQAIRPQVRELGDDVDTNKKIADDNEADASRWRILIASIISAVILFGAVWFWRKKMV